MRQFPWEAMLALAAGLGLGLYYAWVLAPVRYVDTTPNTLRADFKDEYRIIAAGSYASDHDLPRAKARLALLGDTDSVQTLSAQAQRMLAEGQPFTIVQQLAMLATDLESGVAQLIPSATLEPGVNGSALTSTFETPAAGSEATPALPADSPTPAIDNTLPAFDTPTPRPTHTPVPTLGAPFVLLSDDKVCNTNLTDGLMQITVLNYDHRQMPGIEIIITWDGGDEHVFTGLKPEIANGYADYVMQSNVSYTVRIAESGVPVSNLTAPACSDSTGQTYFGGLHLTFQQP